MTATQERTSLILVVGGVLACYLLIFPHHNRDAWALSPTYTFQVVAQEGGTIDGYGLRNISSPLSITDNGEVLFTALISSMPASAAQVENWGNGLFTQHRPILFHHDWNNSKCFIQFNTFVAKMNNKGDLLRLCAAEPGSPKRALFLNDTLVAETGPNLLAIAPKMPTGASYSAIDLTDSGNVSYLGNVMIEGSWTLSLLINQNVAVRLREMIDGNELCALFEYVMNTHGSVALVGAPLIKTQFPGYTQIECLAPHYPDQRYSLYKNGKRVLNRWDVLSGKTIKSFHLIKLRDNGQLVYELEWDDGSQSIFLDDSIPIQPGDSIEGQQVTSARVAAATEDQEFFMVGFEPPNNHRPGITTRHTVLIQAGDQLNGKPIAWLGNVVASSNGKIAFKVRFEDGPDAIVTGIPRSSISVTSAGNTTAPSDTVKADSRRRPLSKIPALLFGGFVLGILFYWLTRKR